MLAKNQGCSPHKDFNIFCCTKGAPATAEDAMMYVRSTPFHREGKRNFRLKLYIAPSVEQEPFLYSSHEQSFN